jgi:outer membrane protein assembly factor BamB
MQQKGEEPSRRDAPKFADTLAVSSRYGTIWMLQAKTGKVLWQHVSGEPSGPLIHTGDTLYVATSGRSFVGKQIELPPAIRLKTWPDYPFSVISHPGYVTALRASDGTLLWRREGWLMRMQREVFAALDGELLITNNLAPEVGETLVCGIDIHTGETRWTYHIDEIAGPSERLLAVRSGRI